MTTKTKPGELGGGAFASGGSVDSDDYRPSLHVASVTLLCAADQDGDVRAYLRRGGSEHALGSAATALTGGGQVTLKIDFPVAGLGTLFVRYTNTNATAGVASFAVADSGQG